MFFKKFKKLQELYEKVEKERQTMADQLHIEKANNDKLRNQNIQLEQGISILQMENDIVGERLKALCNTFC